MSKRDQIYATPHAEVADFSFDEQVADVFSDMIRRSVPGYGQIITTIEHLTRHAQQPNSRFYDLGCSLGAATLAMRRNVAVENCQIISVDMSPAMIERCQRNIQAYRSDVPVELICGDVCDIDIEDAAMVVLNFTLQFIEPNKRRALLKKICAGMKPGGILLLSEKTRFDDCAVNHLVTELHLDFKRANGYSELEISQKRTSLENVMKTDPLPAHLQRLKDCGFSSAETWFQCYNFASMIAIK